MKRDLSQYPNDDNGNVLWDMLQDGDDLSQEREIDFSVIFPTEDAALQFAVLMLRNDQKVSFSNYEGNEQLPWQVQVHPFILPTHENISGLEVLLSADCQPLGGRNDGWGCMAME